MSPNTIEHMTLHHSHDTIDGVMMHFLDGKVWKHFNYMHPQFLVKVKNVFLGLCINRFNPFESFFISYSCWLVTLMVYNLPPMMCTRSKFTFLFMIIPSFIV